MVIHTIAGIDGGEKIIAENLLKNMLEKLEKKTKIQDIKIYFKKYSETGERHKYVANITLVSDKNQTHNIEVIEWGLQDVFYRAYEVIERILVDKKKE